MELGVCQFRWHEQFHGFQWNFKCDNFDNMSSSMEFHGTRSAPISLTRADGIPWNLKCANFADTTSSMEFHGHWRRQFRWHEKFHGIPCNYECTNFTDTCSSVEFHGTWSAPISLTLAIPWNSMELEVRLIRWQKFHGIPWNLKCANFAHTRSSMELGVRQFCWHEQFHGIPWKLECANFDDTSSSMEYHGTRSAPISLTWAVPWNSMELGMRQFRWHEQFHGIQ